MRLKPFDVYSVFRQFLSKFLLIFCVFYTRFYERISVQLLTELQRATIS